MTLAGDSVKTGGQPGYHAGNSHLNHTNFAIGLPSFPDTVSAPTRHHDCIGMWPTANMCDSLKENRRFPEGYQTSMTNTRLKKLREWLSRWWHSPRIFKFFYLRSRLAGFYQALSRYQLLFWAGLVGVLGGLSSVLFRDALDRIPADISGHTGRIAEIIAALPVWQRLVIPMLGGMMAGAVLTFGSRLKSRGETSTDYMEAVVLGSGTLTLRSSIVKILSAMFSISSGGSIGREGPMVQLSALVASLVGRTRQWSLAQRRLILACGASAGIASAYNAPIAGALFVAEIVVGSIAMETFAPLVFSSVLATQTVRFMAGSAPLYDIPPFRLHSGIELVYYLALGVFAGLTAPWFLRALRGSEKLFSRTRLPLYLRLGLGGLFVGALAMFYPEVCGNGYGVVSGILQQQWVWTSLALLLLFKVVATCSSFGSGAVGGVFTPTLFVGASLGYLFGHVCQGLGFDFLPSPGAFALTGMGMMLAATTHAPLMAIIMIFEMTLDYQLILPLMLGCVLAHFTAQGIESRSIYSGSMERKGAVISARQLALLRVGELMKPDPVKVRLDTPFGDIARLFVLNTCRYIYVVDERETYLGTVGLQDIKEYLGTTILTNLVIAKDLLKPGPPVVSCSASLEEALEKFREYSGERLPVVADGPVPRLLGSLAKTDLLLALAERLPVGHAQFRHDTRRP
ncbi:MAG: chloride channel protein family [Desulfuromonadales bacterium]|jgi:CIC family chloride channel protein|nr:chloride channel protein family [Desulfuromonadales bacterium]